MERTHRWERAWNANCEYKKMNRKRLSESLIAGAACALPYWWLYLYTVYARFVYDDWARYRDFFLLLIMCHAIVMVVVLFVMLIECTFRLFSRMSYVLRCIYIVSIYNAVGILIIPRAGEALERMGVLSLKSGFLDGEYESSWFMFFFFSSLFYDYAVLTLILFFVLIMAFKKLIWRGSGKRRANGDVNH